MKHPAGLFFTDCIFNYFHFASGPSGEEMKIKYKSHERGFRN